MPFRALGRGFFLTSGKYTPFYKKGIKENKNKLMETTGLLSPLLFWELKEFVTFLLSHWAVAGKES